ncbi:MAG: ABC transporter permease subunit [Succinivibrionaceae bacterium]
MNKHSSLRTTKYSNKKLFWRIYKQNKLDVFGLYLLIFLIALVFILPYGINCDPYTQNSEIRLLPPSWIEGGELRHFLGTDEFGRDFLSRLLFGSQNTILTSFIATISATFIGTFLGIFSGISSSSTRKNIFHHLFDIILSIPSILIALITVAILGPSLRNVGLAIGISLLPRFVHTTYIAVKGELKKEYIFSALYDGSSHWQLLRLTILPNISHIISSNFFSALSIAILDISAVGFLGFGAQPPIPEIGNIISSCVELINVDSSQIILSGSLIMLFIISLNLVSHGCNRVLEAGVKHVSA